MPRSKTIRFVVIFAVLVGVLFWVLAEARSEQPGYANAHFLATGAWLRAHLDDPNLVVVDVRDDEHFDGRVIPGAVRLPWSRFREDEPARSFGGVFVGLTRAQAILGEHGVSRVHTVVLYDSVARDGGATASYVFWVLDLLGHPEMRVLERGIEGWEAAGGRVAAAPEPAEPVLYQAPADEVVLRRWVEGDFLQSRLGDPHYTILDVRSPAEYRGETPNQALGGGPLKPGHVPTAVNVDYVRNWADPETKALRSPGELQQLYRGLDPATTVVTYCHSGRRSSFTYFVLRLMGFEDVALYDRSWHEWGNPSLFYPVETVERVLQGRALPAPAGGARPPTRRAAGAAPADSGGAEGGYVSCGG